MPPCSPPPDPSPLPAAPRRGRDPAGPRLREMGNRRKNGESEKAAGLHGNPGRPRTAAARRDGDGPQGPLITPRWEPVQGHGPWPAAGRSRRGDTLSPVPSVPIVPPGVDGDKVHPKMLPGAGREGRMRLPDGAGVGPPTGHHFSLPHTVSAPSHLSASVSPPKPGRQSQDGVGGPMPRGRHGLSGCPRAGKVLGLRKHCSHLPTGPAGPEKQEMPNLLRQLSPRGCTPPPGTPRPPWAGGAEQGPATSQAET